MKWIESQSSAIMEGNQELVWDKLIAALGLPNKLYIPFYDISENINQDTIYQGMRLEVISVVTKEQIPLTLSVWLPDEKRLTLTFHKPNNPNMEPIETYKFYVNAAPDKNKSQIYFVGSMPNSILGTVYRIKEYFDGESHWANSVLKLIVREFKSYSVNNI